MKSLSIEFCVFIIIVTIVLFSIFRLSSKRSILPESSLSLDSPTLSQSASEFPLLLRSEYVIFYFPSGTKHNVYTRIEIVKNDSEHIQWNNSYNTITIRTVEGKVICIAGTFNITEK